MNILIDIIYLLLLFFAAAVCVLVRWLKHPAIVALLRTSSADIDSFFACQVTKLFGDVKRGMIRGTFAVTLDPAMLDCYKKLKLPIPILEGHPVDPSIFI